MTNFKSLYDSENFRKKGYETIDLLADYLQQITDNQSDTKAIPYHTPDEALAFWQADFDSPTNPDVLDFFKKQIEKVVHIHSPRYVGHQVTATLPTAVLSAAVDALLNNSGAIHEMGMAVNSQERIITNWFSKRLGYGDDSYGIITSGGTLANLTALLTARAVKAPEDVWTEGSKSRLAVMVSEQAHYCVDRAAKIMGLGDAGVIKVPTDTNFCMKTEVLEELLTKAKADGLHVFAIVGSACTTSTGSYDDLGKIADFAEKNNIWFHTDGAHGGVAVLSEKYHHLVKGIERANSVIVDFHKMLLIPSLTTGVLYKNPKDSYLTFAQKASYLFTEADEDWYNSGKRTFECTKPTMVSRVYSVLRTHGEQVFIDVVDYLYDLGAAFANMIRQNPNFELAHDPKTNIVCFRFINKNENDLTILNQKIRQKLLKNGRFYLVSTILNGNYYLRVSLMNPLTSVQELEELLKEIEKIGSLI